MGAEKQSSKRQTWFCTTGLSSDIEVEVDDMTYHLNKVLLMSTSRKLHQLITEQEECDEKRKRHEEEEENGHTPQIRLVNFPGGPEIFEMVVKIWYGVKVNLSASTAVLLRCAAKELEMTTEECSPDNLVSKTENFLSHSVFRNTQETIKALKACESVSSLAESIGITKTCVDSIVSIASSSADPSLFSWPMNNTKKQNTGSKLEVLSEDLSELSFPIFKRVVQAMKAKDLSDSMIETSLIRYAKKHIPGITSRSSSTIASENKQRELLETIISYLPISTTSSTTRSLFGLLRSAIILNTSEKCRTFLEKRIGSHLEKATLDDLLIPSYSYLNETLYDVDLVERLIRHFLENAVVSLSSSSPSLTLVGKLIDGVLCEIASDANLKPERFYGLAVSLPGEARLYDDGLYRAIDIYLKSHPRILEAEKEKICSVMDFQKLTIEGCTHAAQNERLPLRAVVKVLFLEQLQLRTLVTAAVTEEDGGETMTAGGGGEKVDFGVWEKVVRENQVLRLDMDAMRTRLYHLESEYMKLKEVIAEIDKERLYVANARPRKWSISKKFGCKFKTQVCDSHEAKMVDRRCQRR